MLCNFFIWIYIYGYAILSKKLLQLVYKSRHWLRQVKDAFRKLYTKEKFERENTVCMRS